MSGARAVLRRRPLRQPASLLRTRPASADRVIRAEPLACRGLPPIPRPFPRLQDIRPGSARLCLRVEGFCRHTLGLAPGAGVLLALSGGADSTALAVVLRLLAPRLDLRLSALSVDHGLRPESAEDAAFVASLCDALDIPCTVVRLPVADRARHWHCGLEDAGRRTRYAALEQARQKAGADWIALGHQAADLSEDILLRLVRGAAWPALGGMAARSDSRRLLRPLLFLLPDALRVLLRDLGLGWREDASNASLAFRRNRLRRTVLPALRGENPALDAGLCSLHRLAGLDEQYWRETLDAALAAQPWRMTRTRGGWELLLPRALLRALPAAARLRLYARACHALVRQTGAGAPAQLRSVTLLALDDALCAGRGNTRFQLPGRLEALVRGGCVRFALPAEGTRAGQASPLQAEPEAEHSSSAARVMPSASSP